MLLRPLLRFAVLLLVPTVFLGSCSKQSEGERCDVLNEDSDCEGSLECVAAEDLVNSEADRCCPPKGDRIVDDRCHRAGATPGTGGTGGTAGAPGVGGATGGAAGGEGGTAVVSCRYRSDCPAGQTCGPDGKCQPECRLDVDCFPGYVCSPEGRCELPGGTGGAAATGGASSTAGASGHAGG